MTSNAHEAASGESVADRRAHLDKKPEEIAGMFDAVASRYDLANSVLSMGMVSVWRRATRDAVDPQAGQVVLDVAAGTGTSSVSLMASGARVIALDLSEGMLEVGRQRHPEIEFALGSATDLPFQDDTFDAVTISYGIRNIDDGPAALRECHRVTKPGGRLVVCEFSSPTPLVRPAHHFYLTKVAPALARLTSPAGAAYDYLTESIEDWYTQEELGSLMKTAGWVDVEYRNLMFGAVALHRGFKA